MAPLSPEKGLDTGTSLETSKLIVRQPAKLAELGQLLETIESLSNRVSERTGEDRSGDVGGAGLPAGGQQGTSGTSPRDQAIKNLPVETVMREKLQTHIEKEVRDLSAVARTLSSRTTRPGGAYKLNELYARIRRLHSLLHDLVDSSIDILKRLYIRVFVDQQPVL